MFRPLHLVCTSKTAIFRLAKTGKWQWQLANVAMPYLVNFWCTDKLWGSKSIRISPGIHFWGLQYPQIKFRVQKQTFSFLDNFPCIFPSSLEHSQTQKPQSFGASYWPQQHQYSSSDMSARRDDYVDIDFVKKSSNMPP